MVKEISLRQLLIISYSLLILTSCSVQQKISKSAKQHVLKDSSLLTAHVGISIYDPAENKYWYNYNGEKYFVPASNTKIPTCYVAMKYLGDSLVGFRYMENENGISILPSGDPSFLHPDYNSSRAIELIKKYKSVLLLGNNFSAAKWGSGWTWNDYTASYMAERSAFPMYGNVAIFSLSNNRVSVFPTYFSKSLSSTVEQSLDGFEVNRSMESNDFSITKGRNKRREVNFSTGKTTESQFQEIQAQLILDTLKIPVSASLVNKIVQSDFITFYSQPTDSLLKPLMHRSDNFFAEQSLLMVSNERLGYMSDQKIIDTLLKTDFKDLPQKPRWADGSGLSRYNLFSPQDFVFILNKMKNEFGMERIKVLFPTGGTGTISNFYKADSTFIYAKTGTLSGVVALSGYLYTKKGKLLIFSTLVNNHQASAVAVRRAVEKFIHELRIKN